MTISITYLKNNITQQFEVIDQKLYDRYQYLNQLIPKQEDKKNVSKTWLELNETEQQNRIDELNDLKWIGEKHKEGKICTTESAIYKAYLANDGVLCLPQAQGGNHFVMTNEIINQL